MYLLTERKNNIPIYLTLKKREHYIGDSHTAPRTAGEDGDGEPDFVAVLRAVFEPFDHRHW